MTTQDRYELLLAIEYIDAMLSQLRLMAQGRDLRVLAYLIDMAQIEASESARQLRDARIMTIRN